MRLYQAFITATSSKITLAPSRHQMHSKINIVLRHFKSSFSSRLTLTSCPLTRPIIPYTRMLSNISYHKFHRRTSRGGGGEGGCSPTPPPPQLQKFWKFWGQNAGDSGKSTREKTLYKVVKATFPYVCLVKTELRSNDVRIQEKPYIVYMYIVEISRDGCYFHQQNYDISKRRPRLLFLWWL